LVPGSTLALLAVGGLGVDIGISSAADAASAQVAGAAGNAAYIAFLETGSEEDATLAAQAIVDANPILRTTGTVESVEVGQWTDGAFDSSSERPDAVRVEVSIDPLDGFGTVIGVGTPESSTRAVSTKQTPAIVFALEATESMSDDVAEMTTSLALAGSYLLGDVSIVSWSADATLAMSNINLEDPAAFDSFTAQVSTWDTCACDPAQLDDEFACAADWDDYDLVAVGCMDLGLADDVDLAAVELCGASCEEQYCEVAAGGGVELDIAAEGDDEVAEALACGGEMANPAAGVALAVDTLDALQPANAFEAIVLVLDGPPTERDAGDWLGDLSIAADEAWSNDINVFVVSIDRGDGEDLTVYDDIVRGVGQHFIASDYTDVADRMIEAVTAGPPMIVEEA